MLCELRSALARCKDGVAGPDGLSYPFLRHLHHTAMEFPLSFFNWVHTFELFPDLWHLSIIISISKPGKGHSLPLNFCPISLTLCLFKLLGHMVWVLEDIQGLSPLQFGFRRFRSTANPLLCLKHDISAAFENGKFVLAVFFDLQKAYDTTWKHGHLRTLLSLSFCGHLPLFIQNLVICTFRVRVGGHPLPVF